MKKLYLIIGIAILVLALAVLLLFVIGGKNETEADDPDSLYKYYYEKDGNSTIVTVKGSFPDGYLWKADSQSDGVAVVSCISSGKKEASFRVSPVGEGRYTLLLSLQNDGIMPDRIYEISVGFEADPGSTTVIASSSKGLDGLVTNEKSGYRYSYAAGPDNSLYVSVQNADREFTEIVIGGSVYVSAADTKYTDDGVIYVIKAVSTGKSSLCVCDVNEKKAIRFELEVLENGKITVGSHGVSDYDITTDPNEERKSEAEKLVGDITLPDDCTLVNIGSTSLTVSYSEYYNCVDITFERAGRTVGCLVIPDAGVASIRTYFAKEDSEVVNVKVGEYDALRVDSTYYTTVIWEENGNTFALTEVKASADYALEDAEAIAASFKNVG